MYFSKICIFISICVFIKLLFFIYFLLSLQLDASYILYVTPALSLLSEKCGLQIVHGFLWWPCSQHCSWLLNYGSDKASVHVCPHPKGQLSFLPAVWELTSTQVLGAGIKLQMWIGRPSSFTPDCTQICLIH